MSDAVQRAYSPAEFCSVYGVGMTFTYAELKAGRLKARKAGRRTLILREEAERWANALPEARAD